MSRVDDNEVSREDREAAKGAIKARWFVERCDYRNGSISYEVWSHKPYSRICRISDDDNPCAKRDAEHIAELHNAALSR